MMAPVPSPAPTPRPEPDPASVKKNKAKKKEGDPLSFLASITERVMGTKKKATSAGGAGRAASSPRETGPPEEATAGAHESVAASSSPLLKKSKKTKKSTKTKMPPAEKKRKRDKAEEDKDRKVSPRMTSEGSNRPPVYQVVINTNEQHHMDDSNSILQPPDTFSASVMQNEYRDHFLAAQAALSGHMPQTLATQQATTTAAQLQQQLLRERMMVMENPTFSRMPDGFLSRQYAALEQEELELAALRRRRQQLILNMSGREELLLRNAAVGGGNFNAHALLGLGGGLNNNNPNAFDLAGGPSSAAAFNLDHSATGATSAFGQTGFGGGNNIMRSAVAAAMGYPSSALTSGMGSNSPLLRALAGQNNLSSFSNPSMASTTAAALPPSALAASEPSMTMSASFGGASATVNAAASGDIAAKRLAPARGVFDKNIKSDDDVIDSLARANARFYKNDSKKAGQQRFRGYQCEQWTQKFQDLLDFKREHGNCQVPHCYRKNIGLARWVKRQRYQYKLMVDGKQSTMTEERVKLLQDVGFVWDSHSSTWEERLNELREYARIHGDCNVPSSYSENPKLATWIKCQRRQYKLLQEGRTSNMTLERMTELQRVGFSWRVQDERR